ncbi:MAG: RIP metalloprotease RseP [Elusimicrobia bacterium RIFOXYA12_FULL_51_18]|nr:MAG: RIP metalloprotease RseP [Elusimicrobia bacterium RIFOXYA12_FULL_51_18]OGS29559.1 MAG: RIP metalloprotease RseP [Elusimicrobia bacterium RIFOXYA2_FULL_53_38]
MILSIAAVLFTFGLVIFLHELGHFLVCKLTEIKVEAFSFGFGPELFGRTKGGTRYSIRAIPLGGYVKPAGENIEEVTGHPDEYFSKPWYTRLGVVLAGPFMNYLLAFVIFTGVILIMGEPVPSADPVVGELSQGYPAYEAGIKAGDRVLSVDGVQVKDWSQMADLIHKKPGASLLIEYNRGAEKLKVKVVAKKGPEGQGLIGIAPGISYKYVGALKAARMGVGQCYYWTKYTVTTLASNIRHREKPDLSGPIGIVNIVSKAAHTGMPDLFFLIALISVAIGFFNLLPIPLLDGGHAVLFIMEGVFRRKVTPRVMGWLNSTGIAFLVGILIFATYSDIKRLMAPKAAPVQVETPAQGKK